MSSIFYILQLKIIISVQLNKNEQEFLGKIYKKPYGFFVRFFGKSQHVKGALPLYLILFWNKVCGKPHHLFLLKEKGGKKFKSAHTPSMHEAVKCLKS